MAWYVPLVSNILSTSRSCTWLTVNAPSQLPCIIASADLVRAALTALTATVALPAASSTPTPTNTAVFILVQAIIFNAPLVRVKVEVPAATPFAAATAEIVCASPTGAACAEWA